MANTSTQSPQVRVAICGAGVGGLVLAITIGKCDPSLPIDLYEAHDSIETPGVGIAFWKRTNDILAELGLLDEIRAIYTQSPDSSHGPYLRRSDIREGGYAWYHQVHEFGPSFMHRQQMVAILEKHLPASCTVHYKKRLIAYTESNEQTSPITLNFADGTTATTNVLVGADGIRSAVRKTMFEMASGDRNNDSSSDLNQCIDAIWTGISIYRSLVPAEAVRQLDPDNLSLKEATVRMGRHKYIMTYPIANGALVNVAAVVADPSLKGTMYKGHWVSEASREELIDHFDNFEPEVRMVLQHCKTPSKWALHVVKQPPFCVRGRVSLIGDACHAMTPHFGAGAGQAVEDAFVLGHLIAHPLATPDRIPDVLRIYEQIRLPVASSIASLSLSTGWVYLFLEPGFYDGSRKDDDLDGSGISAFERAGMEQLKEEHYKRWQWMGQLGSAMEAWKDAEARLQDLAA